MSKEDWLHPHKAGQKESGVYSNPSLVWGAMLQPCSSTDRYIQINALLIKLTLLVSKDGTCYHQTWIWPQMPWLECINIFCCCSLVLVFLGEGYTVLRQMWIFFSFFSFLSCHTPGTCIGLFPVCTGTRWIDRGHLFVFLFSIPHQQETTCCKEVVPQSI